MEILRKDTDYAIRSLIYIAKNGRQAPVTAGTLADAEDIPIEFIYKILRKLNRAGFLKRQMGPHGGFSLAQHPEQISLLAITGAIQGPVAVRKCLLDHKACPRRPTCSVSAKLQGFQDAVEEMLKNITLAEVLESRYSQPETPSLT
jgi:Rrf2 family protein